MTLYQTMHIYSIAQKPQNLSHKNLIFLLLFYLAVRHIICLGG